jgi:hypothetical protein
MATDSEHERLQHLEGTWKTEGWTRELPGRPKARIDATDTYSWLPGGRSLLHTVDASVGDEKVKGSEIIGFDSAIGSYVTRYFGTDGPAAYEANFREDGETLVWEMHDESTRFAGLFSAGGDTITGHWELLEGGTWLPWMDITLTKRTE